MLIKTPYQHKVKMPIDDGSAISFKWHFKKGTLSERMSGFELATFVLGHMPHIVPLLSGNTRAQKEFETMFLLLATRPKEANHKLLGWIRSVTHTEEDDIIHMSLFDKTKQKEIKYFSI